MKDLQTLKEAYEGIEKEGYVIGELGAVTICTDGEVVGYPQAVGGCVSGEVMINMHSPYVMALSCLGEDLPCITHQMLSVIGGKVSYSKDAYFGNIRTLISETSGQHNGNIRTAFRKHSDTLS